MAQYTPTLNPPKALILKRSNPDPSFSSFSTFTTPKPKSINFPKFSMSVTAAQNQQHYQEPPSLEALINGARKEEVLGVIKSSSFHCLSETNLHLTVPGLKSKIRGKVRDVYDNGDYLVMVTTDRQSAFDRILASIPFKGQVLNETSLWWFDKTQHITSNAVVSAPDENVTIAKKCSVFPVEFVVRGFVTGSTDTSLWTVYKNGARNYCGNVLPDGLVKSQKLPANILTPTTKAADHDVPVTPDEIIERGLMTQAEYDEVSRKALSLFEYGQHVALEHGLILVDTKYEFGKGQDGSILLIDEVHTPDSSRYWIAHTYEERFQNGLEPENVDKEFLRLWFKDHCNPYEDEVLPDAPEELVCELAWRYIFLYETITKSKFKLPSTEEPIHDRISRNVARALASLAR
ncbi:phosphoribosylaminoimidazole-succinocarboxamide synthase, chloroplastic-like [Malus sylvestris]|uniref:phosphoribosylaminoimidazole-succinocarboxamide synthase, chloroplastic-like n=1 Tax=Malus sylvestris TaxID=3752 RepID=UPI0021ACB6DD|nr:phosphoribosylaminoimidazole-succinocarboxamide synthase, chloroplastic-like [Malus sylvestris]